ncbi:MAG: MotA/TolQ/ExbB proton channel family protein, partial [Gammaproteobacteria bacterium]
GPIGLISRMGWAGRGVVAVLFAMSAWSIAVMLDRWLAFTAARKESLKFVPLLAGALREGKLEEAIRAAEYYRRSHMARVLTSGLQELKAYAAGGEIPEQRLHAARRALERARAIVHAEMERGLSALATIGSVSPFVGLFGTVVGIMNCFRGLAEFKSGGFAVVSGGIAEALVTTAIGLFVAIPAVWMYNEFTARLRRLDVEMENSSGELVDEFLKRSLG